MPLRRGRRSRETAIAVSRKMFLNDFFAIFILLVCLAQILMVSGIPGKERPGKIR